MEFFQAQLPFLCVFLAWFGGGVVSVATGFGCGLFAMPFMLLCLPPEIALPVNIVLCCFCMSLILIQFWRNISCRHFLFCSLFAAPAAFLGVLILRAMPVGWIQLGFGMFLICAVASEIARRKILSSSKPVESKILEAALAFLAGILDGICGMGGPALGLCAALAHWDKDMTRGTFGLFFGVNLLLCVVFLNYFNMLGSVEISFTLWALPGALLGTLAGIPLAKKLPQEKFTRLLLAVIAVSGITLVWKGWPN